MVPPRTPAFRGTPHGSRHCSRFRSRALLRSASVLRSSTASAVATLFHVGVPNAHTPIALSSIVRIASIPAPKIPSGISPTHPLCETGPVVAAARISGWQS